MFNQFKKLASSSTSKDTIISLIGNGGVAVGGALFTVIVARSLAPSQFGIFSALLALAILLASLGDLGISAALVNFLPKLKNNRSIIISTTFWFQLATSLVLALILLGAIPIKHLIIPGSVPFQFVLLALLTAIGVLEAFTQSVLKAERHFVISSVLQVINSAIKLIILIFLFFSQRISIQTALIATIISATLVTLIALSREFKNISFIFPKVYFRKIFNFAKWIAVTRAFSVAVARIDILLLVSLSSSYQAGIFAAAGRIALLFSLLVSSLGNVVAPRFSSFKSNQEVVSYIKKTFLLTSIVSLGVLFSIIFAEPIITIIFGTKYLDAVLIYRLLTIAMIPFMYSVVTVNPLIYFFNQPDFIAKITILQVSLLIILDIILIPSLGAVAPTISLAVSNILVLILTGHRLKKLLAR